MTTKKNDLIMDKVYDLLDQVDREFSNARRRLATAAADAIPTATRPSSLVGAPAAVRLDPVRGGSSTVAPDRRPLSFTEDVQARQTVTITLATLAAAVANVQGATHSARPESNVRAALITEALAGMGQGRDFDAALAGAVETIIRRIASNLM